MAKQIKKLQTPNLQSPLTAQLLGDAIKARRTQSNLKLEDAAALCGIAKETFMKIEHGVYYLKELPWRLITNIHFSQGRYYFFSKFEKTLPKKEVKSALFDLTPI